MSDIKDQIVLKANGMDYKVDWLADLSDFIESADAILLPRMPLTFEERSWMWTALPRALKRGASIRLVGPSLHA